MGKVFVGGLSRETTTNGLRGYFERFGDISDCVVMKDRSTGAPRGFGFVTYASQVIADRVVLHRHVVEAKPAVPRDSEALPTRSTTTPPVPGTTSATTQLASQPPPASGNAVAALVAPPPQMNGVSSAQQAADVPSKKIFVGGLSHDTSEQDFIAYFSNFGQVVDCVIMCDPHTRKPRGFGFITYDNNKAVDLVCGHKFHDLNGKRVEVKRAIPQERIAADDGTGSENSYGHSGFGHGRRGAPPTNGGAMYHPNPYVGGPGCIGMLGAPVPGPGPLANQGMPPMPGGPAAGMFAGMVGMPNALNPSAWNMNMLPNMMPNMMNGHPSPPQPCVTSLPTMNGDASSANLAAMGGASPALPPPINGPAAPLPAMVGNTSVPNAETNAALNAALSAANSVLNAAAALTEPPLDPATESVALNPTVRNAFANPKNNYGSASAALSAGLRAGYGLDERTSSGSPKTGPIDPAELLAEVPKVGLSPPHETAGMITEQDAQAQGLPPTPAQQGAQVAQVQEQLQAMLQQQGVMTDGAGAQVLTPGQLQQQLQALQQQQHLLQQLQQQQIQLQIQQQKQQQQLQMHLHIQQNSQEATSPNGEAQLTDDAAAQMMQLAFSESSQPRSVGPQPDMPGFQIQGFNQFP